jgi:hypothetical protein
VLKGYDPDEYLNSFYQVAQCSLRNYNNGFTALAVKDGSLSFTVDREGRGATRAIGDRIFDSRYTASDRRSRYNG